MTAACPSKSDSVPEGGFPSSTSSESVGSPAGEMLRDEGIDIGSFMPPEAAFEDPPADELLVAHD